MSPACRYKCRLACHQVSLVSWMFFKTLLFFSSDGIFLNWMLNRKPFDLGHQNRLLSLSRVHFFRFKGVLFTKRQAIFYRKTTRFLIRFVGKDKGKTCRNAIGLTRSTIKYLLKCSPSTHRFTLCRSSYIRILVCSALPWIKNHMN